ncbi:GNAT family N-acetyltransferase [Streptomyces sp. NPDC058045]|uniref:GNAT family N-acetyltransferase n=1 Tax=Streptomyces sp. NPDC058045 TaxID=3346311 RepID=UPI0036EAF22E
MTPPQPPAAWHQLPDVHAFLDRAGPYLHAAPALHTVQLTVTDALRRNGPDAFGGGPPRYGILTADGQVHGTMVRTPPRGALVSVTPPPGAPPGPFLTAAAESLAETHPELPGLTAPDETATVFAGAWQRRTGAVPRPQTHERLYALADLAMPRPAPPGRARPAAPADHALLTRWFTEFAEAIGEPLSRDPAPWAEDRIAQGRTLLWETPDGTPVSLAGCSPEIAGQVRVGPVYTPAGLRGRGYAGAVTAELSRRLTGTTARDILLFTDLANPTSNALYQRIGYRPLRDFTVYAFDPGPETE